MDNINDYISEGKKRIKNSDYTTAIEFFQEVLKIDHENEAALLCIAESYHKKGDIHNAKKCYYRVLSNNPEQTDALNGINNLVFKGILELEESTKEESEMDPDKDFRVANWGDSKQLIKQLERRSDVIDEGDYLSFNDEVALLSCRVIYSFTDDKLSGGMYGFNIEHSNDNKYMDDYEELVDLLSNKYGEPIRGGKDNAIWHDDFYQDDYSHWGLAISLGQLVFLSSWETPNSEISCILSGDNYEINLSILYKSKQFSDEDAKCKKQNKLKGL